MVEKHLQDLIYFIFFFSRIVRASLFILLGHFPEQYSLKWQQCAAYFDLATVYSQFATTLQNK